MFDEDWLTDGYGLAVSGWVSAFGWLAERERERAVLGCEWASEWMSEECQAASRSEVSGEWVESLGSVVAVVPRAEESATGEPLQSRLDLSAEFKSLSHVYHLSGAVLFLHQHFLALVVATKNGRAVQHTLLSGNCLSGSN